MNKTVHFFVQGKGGCGKSFAGTIQCQYIRDYLNEPLEAYDTDQINTTLAHYKSIGAIHIPIIDDTLDFNQRKFDELIQRILETNANVVVDTGSNTFLSLLSYIFENNVIELFESEGKKVFIHTILGGGDLYADTYNGLRSIIEQLGSNTIIWVNEFFGKDAFDLIKNDPLIKTYRSKIRGVIQMPELKKNTIGEDIKILNADRLTLMELQASPDQKYTFMMKNRVKNLFKTYYNALDQVSWGDDSNGKE
ncbi:TPA: hypothetical protein MO340_004233 [Salmonella enterica subsp. salamae serovar 35:g,m,s,t:-]|nr:hypothetical protein [Salmonella enterica subsp. salamae serovar 35:g,m,s,t:-]HCA3549705.1 hypothetical protein [Salmonella enterica subsp. salamae serovar 35:g,m,s,t:-]